MRISLSFVFLFFLVLTLAMAGPPPNGEVMDTLEGADSTPPGTEGGGGGGGEDEGEGMVGAGGGGAPGGPDTTLQPQGGAPPAGGGEEDFSNPAGDDLANHGTMTRSGIVTTASMPHNVDDSAPVIGEHDQVVGVKVANPDTLDATEMDKQNMDDTSYLKSAETTTDSVPEAAQLNEPATGFGTVTAENDERVGFGTAPGVAADAVPLNDDPGLNGEADPDPVVEAHNIPGGAVSGAGPTLDLLLASLGDAEEDSDLADVWSPSSAEEELLLSAGPIQGKTTAVKTLSEDEEDEQMAAQAKGASGEEDEDEGEEEHETGDGKEDDEEEEEEEEEAAATAGGKTAHPAGGKAEDEDSGAISPEDEEEDRVASASLKASVRSRRAPTGAPSAIARGSVLGASPAALDEDAALETDGSETVQPGTPNQADLAAAAMAASTGAAEAPLDPACNACVGALPQITATVSSLAHKGTRSNTAIASLCSLAPDSDAGKCLKTFLEYGILPLAHHLLTHSHEEVCVDFNLCSQTARPKDIFAAIIAGYMKYPKTAYQNFLSKSGAKSA